MEIVKLLVDKRKAMFNEKDFSGRSVLHWAAYSGNLQMVKYLADEKNADFNAKDNIGETVVHVAAERGTFEMVKFLVAEKRADFRAYDISGRTVLHIAADRGNFEMVKFLISAGANISANDSNGKTVLHWAADSGNLGMINFLVNREKVDFYVEDSSSRIVPHMIAGHGSDNLDVVEFLEDSKSGLSPREALASLASSDNSCTSSTNDSCSSLSYSHKKRTLCSYSENEEESNKNKVVKTEPLSEDEV